MTATKPSRTQWNIWVVVASIRRSISFGSFVGGSGGAVDHGRAPVMDRAGRRP